jgi:hypothetical protein
MKSLSNLLEGCCWAPISRELLTAPLVAVAHVLSVAPGAGSQVACRLQLLPRLVIGYKSAPCVHGRC